MDEQNEVIDVKQYEELTKMSSRKERKAAKRLLYQQIKETRELMKKPDLKIEEYQRYSVCLKNLVECYEILDKPKEIPRWVDTVVKVGATAATIIGTAVVKEKLLNAGGLDKSTEGIFNNSSRLLN